MSPLVTTLCDACRALVAIGDEPKADAVAELVLHRYDELSPSDRLDFLAVLGRDFGVDRAVLDTAIATLGDAGPDELDRLTDATRSERWRLFQALNRAPGGTPALLSLRADVLRALRSTPELQPVEHDLRRLFNLWFNRGFLELVQLTWATPARVLERLIDYEAVHEITGFDDLRRRLDARDRRIFAYFHPALPGDPVIFVEVALTSGLATSVDELLADRDAGSAIDAESADTAIFYSITNCQPGLRGVTFGDALIKNVTRQLLEELPHLRQFSTLSPVPGFRAWLTDNKAASALGLTTAERARLRRAEQHSTTPGQLESLRPMLERATAEYLVHGRRGRLPLDPVARFHLRNGARLERVNWAADTSERGMAQSFGLMVNYLYDLDAVEEHQEALLHRSEVAHSPTVAALLDG